MHLSWKCLRKGDLSRLLQCPSLFKKCNINKILVLPSTVAMKLMPFILELGMQSANFRRNSTGLYVKRWRNQGLLNFHL